MIKKGKVVGGAEEGRKLCMIKKGRVVGGAEEGRKL
jgi:hypothetical protein